MIQDNRFNPGRIFHASPWIFASAAGLLALIIAVFAINNFQREKRLMQKGMRQEGRAVLGLVASASRDSLRRALMRGEVDPSNMLQSVQLAIDSGAEHPNLEALYLVDQAGRMLAHSNSEMVGLEMSVQSLETLSTLPQNKLSDVSRIGPGSSVEGNVFMIMAPLNLIGPRFPPSTDVSQMRRRMMGRSMLDRLGSPERQHLLDEIEGLHLFLVAELDLKDFTNVVRKQLVQIVILSIILLLVGAGGIMSLMMLQGLRISQSKLDRMATFTDVLVSSLPIGLIALGQDGSIKTCNRSAREMLDLEGSEAEGKSIRDMVPPSVYRNLFEQNQNMKVSQCEINSSDLPGTERSLIVNKVAIEGNNGKEQGTMLLVQDLSQVRQLEADLQRIEKDAAVGRMAAGVAHELRNPLSSIKGLALLLRSKTDLKGTELEAAKLLTDEVDRLNRSISELLDYTRPVQLKKEMTALDELIRKAVSLVRADAEGVNITITEQYDCMEARVAVDQDKFTQVILNLCLNSIQAMPDGGDILVKTRATDMGVEIEIDDSGPGISPGMLDKAFEPYYTTKNDGTGLGLAMSRKIVEDHGGTITLFSDAGTGTRAVILLTFEQLEA